MTAKPPPPSFSAYDAHARELADMYESLSFEQVHEQILELLPKAPARILDVGAGSGRDAAWLAYRGHEVVAVEPSAAMRRQVQERHPDPRIRLLEDSLPALSQTHRLGLEYDFILASAVWMHVRPEDRKRAFRKLVTLLAPSGRVAISLRLGTPDPNRTMYPVSVAELERLGREFGLRVVHVGSGADGLGRPDVRWEIVVLEYPDDDTGALPLLRHIVLRDDKSSTYKLALLRAIARAADSAPGMARERDDGSISLPLGLVALFWIRMMKPLVESDYPQTPTSRNGDGLGFVRQPFRALRTNVPFDLRPGVRFGSETARALIPAIRDAVGTISSMPARYITYPGRAEQVFRTKRTGIRVSAAAVSLDEPFLRAFGELTVPAQVYRTLARLNVWVEPVLVGEWIALMQQYGQGQGRHLQYDALKQALAWLDPVRDTRVVRERALELIAAGAQVRCIWSGKVLSPRSLDIDHCFPFSAWPCSDLWNLFPTSPAVNREKGNKLITASRLSRARDAIHGWWERTWHDSSQVWRPRFFDEARSSLPLITSVTDELSLDDVFEGVQGRRALLRQDQRLPEWRDDATG